MDELDGGRRRVSVWPYASVEVSRDIGTVVMRVEGEVDIANVARVERAAMEALERKPAAVLVLDLEPLEYLDGAGRAWLYRLGEEVMERGIALEVRRPLAGPAARMFDLVWPLPQLPGAIADHER